MPGSLRGDPLQEILHPLGVALAERVPQLSHTAKLTSERMENPSFAVRTGMRGYVVAWPERGKDRGVSCSDSPDSEKPMNRLFDKTAEQNVHGWERGASLAAGLVLLGKGARRGGVGGLLAMALGGAALVRGLTGRCEAKRLLEQQPPAATPDVQRYAHMPMDSEVHSPDFEDADVELPNSTPMGHEARPGPH